MLDYQIKRKRMVITHTEVPEPIAGRGIAGELTRVALRFAREQKYKVVPACSYAEAFLQRHEGTTTCSLAECQRATLQPWQAMMYKHEQGSR